ncbi:MAG: hypothetical protein LUF87_07385 [Alistipes sp.]|nr:hypothetical protein [Alistipes sp.]
MAVKYLPGLIVSIIGKFTDKNFTGATNGPLSASDTLWADMDGTGQEN